MKTHLNTKLLFFFILGVACLSSISVQAQCPDLICPADEQYQCGEEIPTAPSLNVTEDCEGVSSVLFFETDLNEPSASVCDLETPGTAAGSNQYWSITLPGLPTGLSPNFIWDAQGATLSLMNDELLVTGSVVNVDDPDYRFFVHFRANSGVNWETWSNQLTTIEPFVPRTYKDGSGYAAAGGNLWTTWDYYLVDAESSYLIGEGALSGSVLQLSHAPSNLQYGVQVGEAANSQTPAYGLASWFQVNGTVMGQAYSGSGDISSSSECNNPTSECSYSILRNWTVVYDNGDYAHCEQIAEVGDFQGPDLDMPADITIDCNAGTDPADTGMATATDNCSSASITYTDGSLSGDCPSSFLRTWMATDACDNTSIASQLITLIDTTPPVLSAPPADVIYACGEEIPEAYELLATDDCSEELSYTYEEVIEGNTTLDFACQLSTENPAPVLENPQVWSLFLRATGSTVSEYFILDEEGANFTEIDLGGGELEAHITGTVIRADGNADEAFALDLWLIDKTDYTGWTSQLTLGTPSVPRVSKTFNGVAQAGDDLTWDYWVVDNTRSQLVGVNDYAGDILSLEHGPANQYYAIEVGQNANNYSTGFGIGGWFRYEGTLNGEPVDGQGDIAFGADCPPCGGTITRIWTAIDACGNSASASQVITVNESGFVQGDGVFSLASEMGLISSYPNPSNGTSMLVYRVEKTGMIRIDLMGQDAQVLDVLYTGRAYENSENMLEIDFSNMNNGVHLIRLSTDHNVSYHKVLLSK